MKCLKCFLFLLLTVCIEACKEKHELPSFTKSDFPVSKGSYWVYYYQNCLNGQEYVLTLNIADVVTVNTDTQIICYRLVYDSIYLNDSATAVLAGNTFSYKTVTDNWTQFGNYSLQLPFTIGNVWQGVDTTDKFNVVFYVSKYDSFDNVFGLTSQYSKGSDMIANEIYLAKGVGVVYKSLKIAVGSQVDDRCQSYRLLEYHIE